MVLSGSVMLATLTKTAPPDARETMEPSQGVSPQMLVRMVMSVMLATLAEKQLPDARMLVRMVMSVMLATLVKTEPPDACETMEPSHGGSPQLTIWHATGRTSAIHILPAQGHDSEPVISALRILGSESQHFTGFMVQARDDASGLPVGQFDTGCLDINTMNCFGGFAVRNLPTALRETHTIRADEFSIRWRFTRALNSFELFTCLKASGNLLISLTLSSDKRTDASSR
ncbi:hypothetical protein J6590_097431 [Homalodisca vitripennis]|nr:hypothetical protein J6590_097431 [Homalodisca vitripennis]